MRDDGTDSRDTDSRDANSPDTHSHVEPLRVLWTAEQGSQHARDHAAQAAEPTLDLRVATTREEALEYPDWAQVVVDGRPEPELLEGERLRRIIVPWAGVPNRLRDRLQERPHLELRNSHFNDAFVAQHGVALLLACANRIVEADRRLRSGNWGRREDGGLSSMQLDGRTALLLGYGSIGRQTGRRLEGLGMQLTAYRANPHPGDPVRQFGPGELHQALSLADVVIASLPSTPQTRGLLDRQALAAMRAGSILVNVGRGDLIDEQALYDVLSSGHLLAAGLDVWWRYPESDDERGHTFPSQLPFQQLPNVVMSPHRGNGVGEWEGACFEDVLVTLRDIAAGGDRNVVDLERGY